MAAKMRNIGEACTAANRLYVHESVAAEFGEKFAAKMKAMTVGNGMDEGVTVGPLITGKAVKNVKRLIDGAVAAGATKVCGDEQVPSEGNFVAPTVLTNVPGDDDIVREEIFGPVAAIQTFTDEDDVIARANSTEYGLAAYFFSKDYSRALRVAEKLEYGMVGDEDFARGRSAVLAPFVERDRLYLTDHAHEHWTGRARVNLRREIARIARPA